MPTSAYQVDLKVEIAFNAGFGTPAASRTWTDVSAYVDFEDDVTIVHGRRDERSVADANTLSLTLDNTDGRFTPARVTGAYYPNVKLYRPIRVTATTVAADGSVTSTRFTGYVTAWAQQWDGSDSSSKVALSASSRLMRLSLNRAWKSIIEQNYIVDSPSAYYTLGEPEGSDRANDSSGRGGDPLMLVGSGTSVVFGQATGPGTDSLTAATFAAGKFLRRTQVPIGSTDQSLSFYFSVSAAPASRMILVDTSVISISVDTSGLLSLLGSLNSATSVADGLVHHAGISYNNATGYRFFLDGALVGTLGTAGLAATAVDLSVGSSSSVGSLAHVAVFPTALSDATLARYATAGSTGFAGDTTDARFTRYTTLAGIPTAEVDAEASEITVAFLDTTDAQVVDMLRMVEATEAGVMFDDRDGTLRLHSRAHRYATTAAYTLDMAQHMVEADYSPTTDNTVIFNDVTVTNVAGTYSAHVRDTQSADVDYGESKVDPVTASESPDEPLNLANWWVYAYKEPRSRVPTLTVDVLALVGNTPNSADVLATNIGDRISVANHPSQAKYSIEDYFVEGYTEVYGPESCRMTFNVSSTFPEDTVLIVDDPIYGAVDTYAVAL